MRGPPEMRRAALAGSPKSHNPSTGTADNKSEALDIQAQPLTFSVMGVPIPKARPRFSSRYGRVTVRNDEKSGVYHRQVQMAAWLEMRGRQKFSGPVAIEARFVFQPPQSWSENRKLAAIGTAHTQKPDLDNLLKQILDGMNAVVFGDDASVVEITATKQWGPAGLAVCTVTEAQQ